MSAIASLIINSLVIVSSSMGVMSVIIKFGKFFKIMEENHEDGFKKGFDKIMLESIDEMNTCVESISIITKNSNKLFFILYDLIVGNKYIKKDKDGKIIIFNKSKLYSGFKNKIDELNNKVKKYQQELRKFKTNKDNINDEELLSNCSSNDENNESEEFSSVSSVSSDSIETEEEDNDEEELLNKKENKDDEFYLE